MVYIYQSELRLDMLFATRRSNQRKQINALLTILGRPTLPWSAISSRRAMTDEAVVVLLNTLQRDAHQRIFSSVLAELSGARDHSHTYLYRYRLTTRDEGRREQQLKFRTRQRTPSKTQIMAAFTEFIDSRPYQDALISNSVNPIHISTVETRSVPALADLPLFKSNLTYPRLGTQADEWDEQNGDCAYKVCSKQLNIKYDDIKARFGKEIEDGLTADEIIVLYEDHKRAVKLIDLRGNLIGECDGNGHHTTDVFMIANEHIYELDEDRRQAVLNRLRGGQAQQDEKAIEAEKPERKQAERTTTELHADTFEEALRLAEQHAGSMSARFEAKVQRHNDELAELKAIFAAEDVKKAILKTKSRKCKAYRAQTQVVKALRSAHRANKAAHKAKMEAMPKSKERNIININLIKDNMYDDYIDQITKHGKVYAANVKGRTVSKVVVQSNSAGSVTIHANTEYKAIEAACRELDIEYKHQSTASLAQAYFDTMANGWTKSYYNSQVNELMNDYATIGGLFMRKTHRLEEGQTYAGIDFYRHYPSIARQGNFYTTDISSHIERFKTPSNWGRYIYYIEVKDSSLLDGNGVYDYQITQYALQVGVIKRKDIKYMVKVSPSKTNDAILRSFIDNVYARVSNDKMRKDIVNFMIGRLGAKGGVKHTKTIITSSHIEANYYFTTSKSADDMRHITDIGTDTPIYLVEEATRSISLATNRLINMAIVQRGRMAVHKLAAMIRKTHRVVAIKTDCVVYVAGNTPTARRPKVETPPEPTFGDCRPELIKDWYFDEYNKQPKSMQFQWKQPDWLSQHTADSRKYFDHNAILKYDRAYIEGFAGSGKSHIVRTLLKQLNDEAPDTAIGLSFTNTAALNIMGSTLHSALGVSMSGKVFQNKIKRVFEQIKYILLDEVSMVPTQLWRILCQLPAHIKIYGFGDMRQFKPINEDYDMESSVMFRTLFQNKITLTKQCRADATYADQCVSFFKTGEMPDGVVVVDEVKAADLPDINISYTNKRRREINNIKIAAHVDADPSAAIPMSKRYRLNSKPKTTAYTMTERFDADKLAYIIRNKEQFPQIVDAHHKENHDVFLIPSKYLANSVNGQRVVHYSYSGHKKSGRVYAHMSQSLQNITRQIRHTIARDYYDDIDMANAHPRILQHICKTNRIESPYLDEYVTDRNAIIKRLMAEYGVSKSAIKVAILSIMNGGVKAYMDMLTQSKLTEWDPWMKAFRDEMQRIQKALSTLFLERYQLHKGARWRRGIKHNNRASFCNILMCEMENDILQTMYSKLKADKLCNDDVVLCFDGIMLAKNKAIDDEYMRSLEAEITKQHKIVMPLAKKAMNEHVELPADIPKYEPMVDEAHLVNPDEIDEFPAIYAGMPVIANVNNHSQSNGYLNNQQFKVKTVDMKDGIELESGVLAIKVPLLTIQKDFRPCYCITAHKSQGATISKPHMVHEWAVMAKMCEGRHGQYVCLTRTTDKDLLTIVR